MQRHLHLERRPEDRSIAELFSDLTQETTDLFRKEVELARVEIAQRLSETQMSVASLALGGAVALGGFLTLLAAAVLGLDTVVHQPWMSALSVGGVVFVFGLALVGKGRRDLSEDEIVPQRSLQSLRKDKQLAEKHLG